MSNNKYNSKPEGRVHSTVFQQVLLTIGPILVVIGAIIYSFPLLTAYAGWVIALGGVLGALGTLLLSIRGREGSARVRRLDRMIFLGLLMFIVSGGFMIQGSSSWLVILAVGTVFYIYSVFAKDRALKKEDQKRWK